MISKQNVSVISNGYDIDFQSCIFSLSGRTHHLHLDLGFQYNRNEYYYLTNILNYIITLCLCMYILKIVVCIMLVWACGLSANKHLFCSVLFRVYLHQYIFNSFE